MYVCARACVRTHVCVCGGASAYLAHQRPPVSVAGRTMIQGDARGSAVGADTSKPHLTRASQDGANKSSNYADSLQKH